MSEVLLAITAALSGLGAILGAAGLWRLREKEEETRPEETLREEEPEDRELLEGIRNLLAYQAGEKKEEGKW